MRIALVLALSGCNKDTSELLSVGPKTVTLEAHQTNTSLSSEAPELDDRGHEYRDIQTKTVLRVMTGICRQWQWDFQETPVEHVQRVLGEFRNSIYGNGILTNDFVRAQANSFGDWIDLLKAYNRALTVIDSPQTIIGEWRDNVGITSNRLVEFSLNLSDNIVLKPLYKKIANALNSRQTERISRIVSGNIDEIEEFVTESISFTELIGFLFQIPWTEHRLVAGLVRRLYSQDLDRVTLNSLETKSKKAALCSETFALEMRLTELAVYQVFDVESMVQDLRSRLESVPECLEFMEKYFETVPEFVAQTVEEFAYRTLLLGNVII
jgi:hypothetical protein